jgi:Protein of unknown function (DUF3309)/Glycosyl hydrolases family 31
VSEVAAIVRAAIERRYRLLRCLWQRFDRAASRHEPIIRPTFYDFPEDTKTALDRPQPCPVAAHACSVRSVVRIPPRMQATGRWWPRSAVVSYREHAMGLGTVLLIVLVLMLLGVIPAWPYSRGWGYAPSGIVGVIVVVLLILLLTGRL